MIRTTDPDKMKQEISSLRPSGGGDTPEMCLSGLQVQIYNSLFTGQEFSQGYQVKLISFIYIHSFQLALTGAPASSHIYVFTDAPPKDIYLKETIVALIRTTKSTVNDDSH